MKERSVDHGISEPLKLWSNPEGIAQIADAWVLKPNGEPRAEDDRISFRISGLSPSACIKIWNEIHPDELVLTWMRFDCRSRHIFFVPHRPEIITDAMAEMVDFLRLHISAACDGLVNRNQTGFERLLVGDAWKPQLGLCAKIDSQPKTEKWHTNFERNLWDRLQERMSLFDEAGIVLTVLPEESKVSYYLPEKNESRIYDLTKRDYGRLVRSASTRVTNLRRIARNKARFAPED